MWLSRYKQQVRTMITRTAPIRFSAGQDCCEGQYGNMACANGFAISPSIRDPDLVSLNLEQELQLFLVAA